MFLNTPILNGVIVGVLVIGIFFVMRQVISLWPEVRWLRRFQHREQGAPLLETHSINLLAPMAAMLGERQDNFRLSPTATRALLDGIATRLDERRELTRYLIGLLIFLGLLGTFWGLLETIGAVADAINGLQVTGGDAVQMFAKLKDSIEGPLKGMATAFGASLFGLSGSLVLGFLELQASQAQGRFHIELEEWLAGATRLSSGAQSRASRACRPMSRRCSSAPPTASTTSPARSGAARRAARRRPAPAPRWSSAWPPWPRPCAPSRPCSPAWPSIRSNCAAPSTACPSASPEGDREALLAHQRKHRGEPRPPGRGKRAQPHRAGRRTARRVPAARPHHRLDPRPGPASGRRLARHGGRLVPPPRRSRRLYVAGLRRCAHDAVDGADLPAVAVQRRAVHAVRCPQQPRQRHRHAEQADRRSRQPAVDREDGEPGPAEGSREAHPAASPGARRARPPERRPRRRAPRRRTPSRSSATSSPNA